MNMRCVSLFLIAFIPFISAVASDLNKKSEDVIRLATYNIRTMCDEGDKSWEVRIDALVDVVRRNRFDLFATQEGRTSQLKDMAVLDEYAYVGRDRDGDNEGEHCAIFYKKERFEMLESGDFWYSETPDIPSYGWGAHYRRICTWGYFKDKRNGKTFYVFNSHTDHEVEEARRQSSYMLLERVRKIANGKPVFCAGDFNATSDDEPIQILLKDGLLADSYKCSRKSPQGPVGSFHGYDLAGEITQRIDFIFVPSAIEVLSYRTVDDDVKYRKYSSDHFPVVIEARFR